MKISHYTQGRDNNFNLIRMIAAFSVLVTHSFVLTSGSEDTEPLRDLIGMTLGSIAVDIFFITSGFLVTASLLTRQSTIEFIWARTLRIFPALIVMLVITVFGICLYLTTLPAAAYLADHRTWFYLMKCASLVTGVVYELPGVFGANPYPHAVNGSLWTMPHELRMYMTLAAVWLLLRVIPVYRKQALELTVTVFAIGSGLLYYAAHAGLIQQTHALRLFFMFFVGSAFYVMKDRIELSRTAFWICLVMLVVSAVNRHSFFVVYTATLAYMLFYLAYVPGGIVREYNRLGDYSYGVYIYAFPVQQSVAALLPGVDVPSMLAHSAAVTLVLSVLSWHFLERHALRLKSAYVGHTRRFLAFCTPTRTR